MLKLDMAGKPCPLPVVEAKRALASPGVPGVVVTVDNAIAMQNLQKMAQGLGYAFSCTEENPSRFLVTLLNTGSPAQAAPVPVPIAEGLTILFGGSTLGRGAPELGTMLMNGFILALTQQQPAPKALLFVAEGAALTAAGAPTLPDLKDLESQGVEILTCCQPGEAAPPAVGRAVSAQEIIQRMQGAARLLKL